MGIKKNDLLILGVIIVIGLLSLIYGSRIKQRNPESIFLSKDALFIYKSFASKVIEKQHLVYKRKLINKNDLGEVRSFYLEVGKLQSVCIDECEIITKKSLNKINNAGNIFPDSELINLEGEDYLAALFVDNSDIQLKKVLKNASENDYFKDRKLNYWAGIPYTNYLLDYYSFSIQEKLFPLMFILGLFITFLFVRSINDSLILYLPCLFMAGVSLSMLRFFENEMNMVTSIIPLVIFTVTLSLSFHSFFSIKEFGSLVMFLKNKWKPVFLMMFTTYIGFLSLITSDVSVIVTFGNFSAQLVLLSTVFVYFWYKLLESTVVNSKKENVKIRIDKFVEKALSLKLVIFISILSCLAVVYIPNRLDVLTDATKYFPSDSGLREDILDVSKTVAGIPVLEIVFDLPKDIDQETVYLFNDLENKIKSILFKKKIKILSNNTFVKNVNYKYTGINQLPENLISYFTLRSQLPLSLQDSYPTDGHYRMTLLGEPSDVQDFKKDIEQISDILKDQKFKYSFGGLNYTLMLSQETMISVLYKSFLSSALVVFFCAFIYFKKLKIFLSFVLVSLIPILSSFLFMYIFNYSINIATVMTFSIALGLIGDSSFHIIHARVHHPFKGFNEYSNAVLAPVVVSGVLLFLCFGMFTLNNFLPIRQFGGVLAYVIFTGTLLDIYLLPRLLYPSRHHKDEYNKISKVITN